MFVILILSIIIIALAFAGFGIKMFFKKDGRFEKHCGSVDPSTGNRLPCSCSGSGEEYCHHLPAGSHGESTENFQEV